MITQKNTIEEQHLYIRDIPIDIIIDEVINFPITLTMPPIEELEKIKKLSIDKISINDTIQNLNEDLQYQYREELDKLKKKYNKFKYSSTYLNHLATISMLSGDIEGMRNYLEEAYGINSNIYFKNKLISSLLMNNEIKDAEKNLSSIKNNHNINTNNIFALLSVRNKEFSTAESFLSNSLKDDNSDFNTRLLAGSVELFKGNLPLAIRHFKVALEQEDSSYYAYLNLSIAYILQNNLKKALSCLHKAYSLNPIEKNIITLYSNLLINYNYFEKAISVLQAYLEFDRKVPDIWYLLAKAYFNNKDYKNAIKSLEHQASIDNDNNAIWTNIAVVYWVKGDNKKAFEYFSLAYKNWTNKDEIPDVLLFNFSNFLLKLKEYEEVRNLLKNSLPVLRKSLSDKNDKLFHLILNYAEANFHLGDIDNTINLLEEIVNKYNLNLELKIRFLINITYYYSLIKPDIKKSFNYCNTSVLLFDKINKLDKDLKNRFFNNVAFCLIEDNKFDEAEKILNKLSSTINIVPHPTATLGLFYIKKGNIKKGKNLYEKAIGLTGDNEIKDKFRQKLNYELAKYYSGNFEKAKEYYQKALKYKTEFKFIEDECKKALGM